jgi:hypothetical protein
MNANHLITAALVASFGVGLGCIEEGYDPLELGHHYRREPGTRDAIEPPGAPERRPVPVWHDAGGAPIRPGVMIGSASSGAGVPST